MNRNREENVYRALSLSHLFFVFFSKLNPKTNRKLLYSFVLFIKVDFNSFNFVFFSKGYHITF